MKLDLVSYLFEIHKIPIITDDATDHNEREKDNHDHNKNNSK